MQRWVYGLPSNGIVLEVIPYPLIRIQLWGIWRQEEKSNLSLGFLYKLHYTTCLVHWMSIDDQEYLPWCIVEQSLDEFKKFHGTDTPFDYHETKLTLCTYRRNNIQPETCPCTADCRRLPLHSPRGASMMIWSHTCHTTKKICAFSLCAKRLIRG